MLSNKPELIIIISPHHCFTYYVCTDMVTMGLRVQQTFLRRNIHIDLPSRVTKKSVSLMSECVWFNVPLDA